MLPSRVPVAQVCFASSPAVLSSPGLILHVPCLGTGAAAVAVPCKDHGPNLGNEWELCSAVATDTRFQKHSKHSAWGEPGWCCVEVLNISLQAGGCLVCLTASPILHLTNYPLASGHTGKQHPTSLSCGCKVADAPEGPWPLDTPGLLSGAGDFP